MGGSDDEVTRELEALRSRVGVLERSLGLLVRELTANGTIAGRPGRRVSGEEIEEALESGEHAAAPAATRSPYRDSASNARSCSECGKPLDDDPDLTSASARPVCLACFQRGA